VAIATGAPVFASDPALTTVGYTDVSGVINTNGQKNVDVTVSGVRAGDHLWWMIGHAFSTTPLGIRVGLADDLQMGGQVAATARPSTMSANTTFTVESTSLTPPWIGIWAE